MITIKKGFVKQDVNRVFDCRKCGSTLMARESEGVPYSDKDGTGTKFTCHECGNEIWVNQKSTQERRGSW
jgi:RNase P subunit RPR2